MPDRRPLVAGGMTLLLAGCLASLGPDISRGDRHHEATEPHGGRRQCLACHELESSMATRMKSMSDSDLSMHMAEMQAAHAAPLVQDWMAKEQRDCVLCHKVREPTRARP